MEKTIDDVLELFEGNVGRAAGALGVTRQTIYNWKKSRQLPRPAELAVRNWFLTQHGKVPREWMPA